MKTYKTYNARNAVKAAEVTNHIIARKKEGVTHEEAKAEAYRRLTLPAACRSSVPAISSSIKASCTAAAP